MKDNVVQDNIKKYELMVILNPDIGDDASTKLLVEIRKLITDRKGEIFFEDIWGLRDFAYSIKKHTKGYYAVFDFTLAPEFVREINAKLVLERDLLRHMTLVLPFKYEPKTFAAMQEAEAQLIEAAAKLAPGNKALESKPPKAKEGMKKAEPVKAEVPKKAPQEAPKEKVREVLKKAPEKKETTLEDVDAKLKSIIDNPDINF